MPTLPIIAVLVNACGVVLKFVDGSQTPPMDPHEIAELEQHERNMVQYACSCGVHGWVTLKQYQKVKG